MKFSRLSWRAGALGALGTLLTFGVMSTGQAEDPPTKTTLELEASQGDEDGAISAPTAAQKRAGAAAFIEVARVLKSPRCMNCHPVGDAPLQTDESRPHAMNITRASVEAGLDCTTCHQEKNSDVLGVTGGPPGAPHWGLPPKETPMVFQGMSASALCKQLKDPAQNGEKTLAQLMEHVAKDPLVLWGWSPGAGRTKPPLTHEAFAAQFKIWVDSQGACP